MEEVQDETDGATPPAPSTQLCLWGTGMLQSVPTDVCQCFRAGGCSGLWDVGLAQINAELFTAALPPSSALLLTSLALRSLRADGLRLQHPCVRLGVRAQQKGSGKGGGAPM